MFSTYFARSHLFLQVTPSFFDLDPFKFIAFAFLVKRTYAQKNELLFNVVQAENFLHPEAISIV